MQGRGLEVSSEHRAAGLTETLPRPEHLAGGRNSETNKLPSYFQGVYSWGRCHIADDFSIMI